MVLTLTTFHLAVLLVASAFFIAAAVIDVRSYRIPNYLCGSLLLLFPVYAATSPTSLDWKQNVVVFGVAALVGFALFLGNLMGAGDIKLLSVASLWAGPQFVALLLFVTAFVGGIESLVVATVVGSKLPKADRLPRLIKAEIPYGVAIAAGGVTMLGAMARPLLMPE